MRRIEWGDRQCHADWAEVGTPETVAICPQHYISPGNNVTTRSALWYRK